MQTLTNLRRSYPSFFHWQYSSVVIPFLFPVGLAIAGLAAMDTVPDGLFRVAAIVFWASALFSSGAWLTSETLHKRNPYLWSMNRQRAMATQSAIYRNYKLLSLVPVCFIGGLLAGCLWLTGTMRLNKALGRYEGVLLPAHEPTPAYCPLAAGESGVFFEGLTAIKAARLPLRVAEISPSRKPVIRLNKSLDGTARLDMDVNSDDAKVVVQIRDNQYAVNHNNILKMNRRNDARDESTLSVTDQQGNEVLNLRYLNEHAFSVRSRLSMDGHFLDTSKLPIMNGCILIEKGPEGAGGIAF